MLLMNPMWNPQVELINLMKLTNVIQSLSIVFRISKKESLEAYLQANSNSI